MLLHRMIASIPQLQSAISFKIGLKTSIALKKLDSWLFRNVEKAVHCQSVQTTTDWIHMNSDSLSVFKIIDKYFIKVSRNLGVFFLVRLGKQFTIFRKTVLLSSAESSSPRAVELML